MKEIVSRAAFNPNAVLPWQLRINDFEIAMQDVYDFFADVNDMFREKGLPRLDDTLRKANMSGLISDMLTASMAKHSRSLTQNAYHNGHPDLIVQGRYTNDSVQSGSDGIEIKTTRKRGGAVDTHGGRDQWFCVFVYEVDEDTEPAEARQPMRFVEVYLSEVKATDFRVNERGALGTRTSALHREGIQKLRSNWIYKL